MKTSPNLPTSAPAAIAPARARAGLGRRAIAGAVLMAASFGAVGLLTNVANAEPSQEFTWGDGVCSDGGGVWRGIGGSHLSGTCTYSIGDMTETDVVRGGHLTAVCGRARPGERGTCISLL
jgi:hypothetical protein